MEVFSTHMQGLLERANLHSVLERVKVKNIEDALNRAKPVELMVVGAGIGLLTKFILVDPLLRYRKTIRMDDDSRYYTANNSPPSEPIHEPIQPIHEPLHEPIKEVEEDDASNAERGMRANVPDNSLAQSTVASPSELSSPTRNTKLFSDPLDLTDVSNIESTVLAWLANYRVNDVEDAAVIPTIQPGEVISTMPKAAPEKPEQWETILSDLETAILPGILRCESRSRFFASLKAHTSLPGICGDIMGSGRHFRMLQSSTDVNNHCTATIIILNETSIIKSLGFFFYSLQCKCVRVDIFTRGERA
jgi:hypothetical protein